MARLRLLVTRLPVDPDLAGRADEPPLPEGATVWLVAAGGAAGALCRGAIESAAPAGAGWPWATLAINCSGAALLAVLLIVLEEAAPRARTPRPLLGAGVLGGFTTFSTFAVETTSLLRDGHGALAAGYVVASTLGALAAAALGLVVGRAAARLADPHRWHRRARHAGLLDDEAPR